jgi:phospholipid/cholesterol/gamma-HCH transport system substrate-binding protein
VLLARHAKVQLWVFTIVALVAVTVLAVSYCQLPALLFGIGRYTVTVELHQTGNLYPRANVTYRGVNVGKVSAVDLTDDGIAAKISLHTGTSIPANVTAQVHSQSAIGEQYIDLVPTDPTNRALADGDVIAADRTSVAPDIGELLDTTNTALQAIPRDNLKTVVDESYTALGGLSAELGRIVDGSTNLAIDAKANLSDLTNVVDNAAPILDSQTDTADAVSGWASHMATITEQLRDHDAAVSGILTNAGPAADQVKALLDRVNPTVPILLTNLVSVDEVAMVYQPGIEQLLVLQPQALRMVYGTATANANDKGDVKGAYAAFVGNINLPPTCSTGYLPPSQRRSPVFEDAPPRPPGDMYCRIPQDSPFVVRGARNLPCEGKPGKRAPTVWMCESDEEYVPLNEGNNWKGDPNATLSGQDVPQFPSPQAPNPNGGPSPEAHPAAIGFADYDPATGTYIGPDGQVYTQRNLARDAKPPSLQTMLLPPEPTP